MFGSPSASTSAAAPGRGSGDGSVRGREPSGEVLERLRALVVGVRGRRARPGAAAAASGRTRRRGRPASARSAGPIVSPSRERMPVQELRRLVREEAHQPAGERGEVGDPRRPERLGQRDEVGPRVPGRSASRPPAGPSRPGPGAPPGRARRSRRDRRRRTSTAPSARTARRSRAGCRAHRPRAPGRRRPAWTRRRAARSTPARARSPGPSVRTILDRAGPSPDLLRRVRCP